MSIDLDSSDDDKKQLINHWISNLQKEHVMKENAQTTDDKYVQILQRIQEDIIKATFDLAEHLKVPPNTKYMVILLYEEFLYKFLQQMDTTEIANGLQKNQLDKLPMNSRIKLYLLSCFQIASKIDSRYTIITIPEIIDALKIIDSTITYTDDIITAAEIKVFKTVGFKIPHNTPSTCLETLLAAINCEDQMDIALLVLDQTFLQYEKIYTQFQHEILGSVELKKPTFLKSDMLFLCAAIVAYIAWAFNLDNHASIVDEMIEKSLSGVNDIMAMINILAKTISF